MTWFNKYPSVDLPASFVFQNTAFFLVRSNSKEDRAYALYNTRYIKVNPSLAISEVPPPSPFPIPERDLFPRNSAYA